MIRSEVENGILLLVIDRPEKKNALTADMYRELADQVNGAQENEFIQVILIRSEGKDFCAGNDLADFMSIAQNREIAGDLNAFPPMTFLHALADNTVPIVAAVQGAAIGIGFTLLLHCDFVFCSENTIFHTPFVDLGLIPEAGSSLLLPERIGRANAAEMLLLGLPMTASRAQQLGLCNRICGLGEVGTIATGVAQSLAQKPKNALAMSKRLITVDSEALHRRIDEEGKLFLQCLQSEEVKDAISQFFKK